MNENEFLRRDFLAKPLPASQEAEDTALGLVMIDNSNITILIDRNVKVSDFYSPKNQRIYQAMLDLFEQGKRIESILIGEEIKKNPQVSLEAMGGVQMISHLVVGVMQASATKVESYIDIILEKSKRREMVKLCSKVTSEILAEDNEELDEILDRHESQVQNVRREQYGESLHSISRLVDESVKRYTTDKESGKVTRGLTTGLSDLDRLTGGLHQNDLIIIAARPSVGKSSLLSQIVTAASISDKANVLDFTLEMSKEQVTDKIICQEARVDAKRYKDRKLTREEAQRILEAKERLKAAKIEVDETPSISPQYIRAKARRYLTVHKKLDLIAVDYMQLMTGSGKQSENRQQEVSSISRELKALAKELGVPVIALSQLSRASENRNPPRPMLSDLRESGSIEQDADIVMFIYREEYHKPTEANKGNAEIIIAKNRNNPTGVVKCAWLSEWAKFEDLYT